MEKDKGMLNLSSHSLYQMFIFNDIVVFSESIYIRIHTSTQLSIKHTVVTIVKTTVIGGLST